jgi:aspartyl-tRNA(Asn)/glutamyl-tRNA(Gln) amidotransferase subunit A
MTELDDMLARATRAKGVSTTLTPDRARAEFAAAAARRAAGFALGPLDGALISWKDMIDVAGTVTTAGSALRADGPPALKDAAVVARAAKAGLVTLGKTTQSELAFSGLGLNSRSGAPENGGYVPGGSSSGAAASVAQGIVRVAVGTDTAGSCRIPAAFQGVIGFRPSRGRYPDAGVLPLAPSFDVPGSFARSMADIGVLDAVLSGLEAEHAASFPLAVDSNLLADPSIDPEIGAHVRRALAGVPCARIDDSPLHQALAVLDRLGWPGAVEAAETHRALIGSPDLGRIDPEIAARLAASARMPRAAAAAAMTAATALRARMPKDHVFALPTVAVRPPRLSDVESEEGFAAGNGVVLRLTMIASLLDLPAISLPLPSLCDGAPVGLMLIGPPGRDAALLATASALETRLSSELLPC